MPNHHYRIIAKFVIPFHQEFLMTLLLERSVPSPALIAHFSLGLDRLAHKVPADLNRDSDTIGKKLKSSYFHLVYIVLLFAVLILFYPSSFSFNRCYFTTFYSTFPEKTIDFTIITVLKLKTARIKSHKRLNDL